MRSNLFGVMALTMLALLVASCARGRDACFSGIAIREKLPPGPLRVLGSKLERGRGEDLRPRALTEVTNVTGKTIDAYRSCYVFYDAFDELLYWTDGERAAVEVDPWTGLPGEVGLVRDPHWCFQAQHEIEPGETTTLRTVPLKGAEHAKRFDGCVWAVHFTDGTTWELGEDCPP